MSFRKQLLIGHLMSLLLITGIAIVAITALHVTSSGENRIAGKLADDLTRVQRLRVQAEHVVATSRAYLLTGESQYRSKFESVSARLEADLRDLRASPMDPEGERLARAVERDAHSYIAAATVAGHQRSNTDADGVVAFFDETLTPKREDLETGVTAFADHERAVFDAASLDTQSGAREAQIVVVLAATLAVILGFVLAWAAIRKHARQFERMQDAEHAARAAMDAREEMLAIVSHDLRSPLSSIVAGSALLEELAHDARMRRHLAIVRRAAERMRHMIDELLEAAQCEAGTIVLHCETYNTRPMIEETIELFERHAAERSIHLHADCTDDACVVGDRERIGEVLANLIGNALKFTQGGGEIAVKAERCENVVRFVVADTGPGVAPNQIPHLFERYWQGGVRRDGLGLGLYICKKLVDAHHGSIGVESHVGVGSAFWFTVPTSTT